MLMVLHLLQQINGAFETLSLGYIKMGQDKTSYLPHLHNCLSINNWIGLFI
jgi:hypothetical protein